MSDTYPVLAVRQPDMADALAAGREYPVRDFREQLNPATAAAYLSAIRGWWLDAAEGYCDLASKAVANGDFAAAEEILRDGQQAFAAAERYAPQGAS